MVALFRGQLGLKPPGCSVQDPRNIPRVPRRTVYLSRVGVSPPPSAPPATSRSRVALCLPCQDDEAPDHECELALKAGHRFRTCMFEMDAAASDHYVIVRPIGQVNDLGGHLSGQAKQICSPSSFWHDLPSLLSSYGLSSLVNVGAQLPAERRLIFGIS
jgi:hypothetical protein